VCLLLDALDVGLLDAGLGLVVVDVGFVEAVASDSVPPLGRLERRFEQQGLV
jgi:hypothetical protein